MFEAFEKKIHSQNGEDGVLERIFYLLGTRQGFFVEIGTGDGLECNTRALIAGKSGWHGILFDSSFENSALNLFKERFAADSINGIFAKHRVPQEINLLSIDVDYNDFYLWNALAGDYNAEVVVIEYNASWGLHDRVVIYDENHVWDGTDYFGASITALEILGKKKGYTLLYAEKKGVNLFFVRNDLARAFTRREAEVIYRPPAYGAHDGGHPPDPQQRRFFTAEEAIKSMKGKGESWPTATAKQPTKPSAR